VRQKLLRGFALEDALELEQWNNFAGATGPGSGEPAWLLDVRWCLRYRVRAPLAPAGAGVGQMSRVVEWATSQLWRCVAEIDVAKVSRYKSLEI
jgi:hypothetical protein